MNKLHSTLVLQNLVLVFHSLGCTQLQSRLRYYYGIWLLYNMHYS